MTAVSQNFDTYAGDSIDPIVTVRDAEGEILDISQSSEIDWEMRARVGVDPVLEKKLTTGGISFVTDGTDGQFQIAIRSGETTTLAGRWKQKARIYDAGGAQSTVTVGTVRVIDA